MTKQEKAFSNLFRKFFRPDVNKVRICLLNESEKEIVRVTISRDLFKIEPNALHPAN